jgi:GNAT superfamily N-acetyltransferase
MAKDQTVIGITGKPIPKPRTAKQQYELEKKRRMEKHLGKNVGGVQYSSDVNPSYNPRARTFREFVEIAETITEAKEARPPKEVLSKIAKAYGRKHRGVNVDTSHSERTGNIRVDQLWVPPHLQGKGIGTRVMKGLGKYADKTGKKITLNQDPDPGKKKKLADFYKSHGFEANRGKKRDFSTSDTHIRHPQVRESIKLLDDAWIPPASKRLRGGTESPLSAARKKGTDVNKVRASVKTFAEPINNPGHPDIDYKKNEKTGEHTFTHRKHPIQVKYSAGDKPGTFIQNTTKTGETTDKVGAARAMQDIKKRVSSSARPGTTLVSQPVGNRRASLNTRTQGMSAPNEKGVQAGIARHRSPKQKAKGAKPLDPVKHTGTYIDPNH